MSSEKEKMLTVREAAKELRVSPQTVNKWAHEGKFEAYQYDELGLIRIPLESINAFKEKSRMDQKAEAAVKKARSQP